MIKVKKRKFLLLPGDGIGPEVVREVKKVRKMMEKCLQMRYVTERGPWDTCDEKSAPFATTEHFRGSDQFGFKGRK